MAKKTPTENFVESLHDCMVFDARDWALDNRNAWMYGIVVGWDADSMADVAQKHGWTPEEIDRLKRLHGKAAKVFSPKR
jgi:hypothetical protein